MPSCAVGCSVRPVVARWGQQERDDDSDPDESEDEDNMLDIYCTHELRQTSSEVKFGVFQGELKDELTKIVNT